MRPTSQDVYKFLEGYGIEEDVISSGWIDNRIGNFIIPWIERHTRMSYEGEKEYTEYLSGTGKEVLVLSRKPVNSIVSLTYISGMDTISNLVEAIKLDKKSGIIIKRALRIEGNFISIFPKGNKNILVTYKYGYEDFTDPDTSEVFTDVKEAIIYMAAKQVLIKVGARTGGGSISTQAWSRNFGSRGKYTDIINNLDQMAYEILRGHWTGVIAT